MQVSKDQRFLRWWDDQRSGGVVVYVLLYTLVWTLIIFLSAIFFPIMLDLFFRIGLRVELTTISLIRLAIESLVLAICISGWQWKKNETRWIKLNTGTDSPLTKEESAP